MQALAPLILTDELRAIVDQIERVENLSLVPFDLIDSGRPGGIQAEPLPSLHALDCGSVGFENEFGLVDFVGST